MTDRLTEAGRAVFTKASPKKDRARRKQYGALPYRVTASGSIEILLVTTRQTKRWAIPKGWPAKKLKPCESAAREAYEEAGVRGTIGAKPIGTFTYEKLLDSDGLSVSAKYRFIP